MLLPPAWNGVPLVSCGASGEGKAAWEENADFGCAGSEQPARLQSVSREKLTFPSTFSSLLQFLGTKLGGNQPDVNHQELQSQQGRLEALLEQHFLLPRSLLSSRRCLCFPGKLVGSLVTKGFVWGKSAILM